MPKNLGNVKEDILIVSRQMLLEEGYSELNMRKIASKCGIATGTLYNYFKSKQDIVREILQTEWNMMMRRIEQVSKTDIDLIEKLKIIYEEMKILMNNAHKIWIDNFLGINEDEMSKIHCPKDYLLKNLSDVIYNLIKEDRNKEMDYEFLSDVICKLFVSYAYETNMEFTKLSSVIISILSCPMKSQKQRLHKVE